MKSLSDLVSQAESLAVDLEEDDIPRVRRRMEELRGMTVEERDAGGRRTGLSEAVKRSLEGVRVVEGDRETKDVSSFLRGEREAAVLRAIETVRSQTAAECRARTEKACGDWWKEEKAKILSALASGDKVITGLASGDKAQGFLVPTKNYSIMKRTTSGMETQISSKLGKEEANYARQISIYVDSLLTEVSIRESFSICELLLSQNDAPMMISKCSELREIARLITRYCSLSRKNDTDDQRQLSNDTSKMMISAALVHLETELFTYMQQYLNALSFETSTNNRLLLVTFLNSQMSQLFQGIERGSSEDGCIDGVPTWPLIYLCLRVGLQEEAIQVAKEASSNIGDWYIWLNQFFKEGRVSSEFSRKILADYKRSVRGSNDGYKRLVYCVVGGCDIEDNHPQVLMNVDDFMWVRLSHLRRSYYDQDSIQISLNRSRRSSSFEHQSLLQLQRLITEEYGESHFQAQQQPVTYCKLLLLCQLPEAAIVFLARFDHLRCHSVHMGLVLWFYGLVVVSENIKAPLLSRNDENSQGGTSRLNLSRLVTLYTRNFESLYPKETMDLFFLLSNLPNDNVNPFVCLTSALVVEHGHLNLILGGSDSLGLVSRYGKGMREEILEYVSNRFIESGRSEEACDTLLIAGRLLEAANILSNLLASSLTLPSSQQQDSLRLRSKAEHLRHMMPQCKEANTLSKVLDVLTFMCLSIQGDIDSALIALDHTNILPSSATVSGIRSSVESFRSLPEIVRNLIPSILLTSMRLLRQKTVQRKSMSYISIEDVRARACALITFTGQLPYRLPADVYATLSQLEMDITVNIDRQ